MLENVQEKLCYDVPLSKLQVFRLQPLALPSMFVKFWKIPEITCAVEFRHYQVLYRRSIHADLIMSVLWKKTEFYKGESDREGIVIALLIPSLPSNFFPSP